MTLLKNQGKEITLQFSIDELIIINNALNEVCNGIDVPEFHSRVGASLDQVRTLQTSIAASIDKVEP